MTVNVDAGIKNVVISSDLPRRVLRGRIRRPSPRDSGKLFEA